MGKTSDKNSVRVLVTIFLFAIAGLLLATWLFFWWNGDDFRIPAEKAKTGQEIALVKEAQDRISATSFQPFQTTPSLMIWFLLSSIALAFASAMIYECWLMYRKMKRVFSARLTGISIFVFSMIIAGVFLPSLLSIAYKHQLFPPITDFSLKLGVITAVHALAAGACIVCIVLTGNLAFNLRKRMPEQSTTDYYATLHQLQMRLVLMIGIQLTLGIIATAVMRQVHIELYGPDQKFIFKEGVAYYGIFYTFLIAVFFIPARRELTQFGYRIVDKECGKRPEGGKTWKEWMEEREVLVKLFKLEMSFKELAEWAVPVLAPLVASILPEFLRG